MGSIFLQSNLAMRFKNLYKCSHPLTWDYFIYGNLSHRNNPKCRQRFWSFSSFDDQIKMRAQQTNKSVYLKHRNIL